MRIARLIPLAAALALAACQQTAGTPEGGASASGDAAAPDAKPGIVATDGSLVLPVVKGNPGVAYFTVHNGGEKAATLAAISIDGVDKAEMHETSGGTMAATPTVAIAPGETVRFERGGRHVMLFGVGSKVTAGGSAEMTLIFADGDKVSAPLMVETMGDAMEGMDHGGMH